MGGPAAGKGLTLIDTDATESWRAGMGPLMGPPPSKVGKVFKNIELAPDFSKGRVWGTG